MKRILGSICYIMTVRSLKGITPNPCVNCKFFISLEGRNEYGRCSLFTPFLISNAHFIG